MRDHSKVSINYFRDLAIEMHSMVGNWERVIELALTSNESNIALIEAAYNQLGQTHMENGYW